VSKFTHVSHRVIQGILFVDFFASPELHLSITWLGT